MSVKLPDTAANGEHRLAGTVLFVDVNGNPLIVTGRSLANAKPVDVSIVDASGNQITSFGGGSGGTSSTFGAAFPASGTAVGATDGVNMQPLNVDGSGNLKVNIIAGGGTGGGPSDVGATTAASESDAARQKVTSAVRLLDTGQAAGSQLVTAKGDQTNGMWVNVKASIALPVTGTFWQATQPVSGTVTANIGTTNGLALDATLTGGSQKSIVRGGQKGATNTNADITHTAEGADHEALDVQIYHGGVAKDPTAIRALTSADIVTAAQGAAAAASGAWTFKVTDGTNVAAVSAANALKVDGSAVTQPVSGTFWQATQPVSGTVTANIGTTNGLALDATLTGGTAKAIPVAGTTGGASMSHLVSAASTNATNVKGSAGTVYGVQAFNTNASPRYLKLYDKATTPVVGTDTPVKTLLIPGNASGAGVVANFPVGTAFAAGIGFALTTGPTDGDSGAVGANDCVVDIDYK